MDRPPSTDSGRPNPSQRVQGWFAELRRRHIFKVAIGYLVSAWLLMQVASVLEASLKLPDWIDAATFVFLVIGFPIALILTWAVDLTPVRSRENDSARNLAEQTSAPVIDDPALPNPARLSESHAKSSIAVLPFENISGDTQQDFIGEGIAADIIASLSRIRSFFVIARNSTFQYKGASPDVRQVAKDLDVRYVLEGATQKSGDRLRLSVQLIDGQSGHHLWAEKYDRNFQDLFEVQDELTRAIVGQLGPELGRAEYERSKTKKAEELDAWELYHRGMFLYCSSLNHLLEARHFFERAIQREPNFALAYAGLSLSIWHYAFLNDGSDADYQQAVVAGQRAAELDDRSAQCHCALAHAFLGKRDLESAIHEAERAIDLDPNFAVAYHALGTCLTHCGRAEEAIPHLEKAIALSPRDPQLGLFFARLGLACLYLEQHERAITWCYKAQEERAGGLFRVFLISALWHADRVEEAREAVEAFKSIKADASISYVERTIPTVYRPYLEHLIDGLRKAGLPERVAN